MTLAQRPGPAIAVTLRRLALALCGAALVTICSATASVDVLRAQETSRERVVAPATELDDLLAIEKAIVEVAERTTPAVVFISGGSGVCISPDGIILTNDHVVGDQNVHVVRFALTGLRRRADLLGKFPDGDIAILKIVEGGEYPHLPLGDSDALSPGERVIALGNPFLLAVDNASFPRVPASFYPSTSLGVVSALHRNSPPRYTDAIQVDVAVNPGNSGGPLINLGGEVVGINGKIETRLHISVNSGVGYAVPSNQVRRFLAPMKAASGGAIPYGILGVEVAERVEAESPGLAVVRVASNSPAAAAGLTAEDRILTIDSYPIPTRRRFEGLLKTYPVGFSLPIQVQRGTDTRQILATLVHPDHDKPVRLGVRFVSGASDAAELQIDEVTENSPAARAGLLKGDVIVRFDNERVSSFAQLASLVQRKRNGDVVVIRVRRDREERDIVLLLQSFEG